MSRQLEVQKITLIISITNDHWSSVDIISDNHLPPKHRITSDLLLFREEQNRAKNSLSLGEKNLAYYAHMFSSRNVLIHLISDIFMILNSLLSVRITPARERTTHGHFYWKQVSFRFFVLSVLQIKDTLRCQTSLSRGFVVEQRHLVVLFGFQSICFAHLPFTSLGSIGFLEV